MLVYGSIPFANFKERIRIIKNLKKELGNKVKIYVDGNLVIYKYFDNTKII